MFLREAHEVYCQTQDNPVSFSTFCDLRPKNVLLLADSPKDQCRCLIHENILFKLDAIRISYDSSFWTKILCLTKTIVIIGILDGMIARMGKKLVPMKLLNATANLRQWEKVTVEKKMIRMRMNH